MANNTRSIRSAFTFSLLLTSALSTSALAQFDTITVTATKRAESIQDVPIAITALGAEDISRAGIDNLDEYAFITPGLAITRQGTGRTQINIRGISPGEIRRDNIRAQETVGIYLDEIPISTALYNPDLDPFDMQRIEILRGPQGTLYGAGSLAGTIRLISNEPNSEKFEAALEGDYSSTAHGGDGYAVKGMINVPLVEDVLAFRLVGYHNTDAGWIDNVAPNITDGEDVNSGERTGVRVSMLWTPTDVFSAKATYVYQNSSSDGAPFDFISQRGVSRLETLGGIPAGSVDGFEDREYEAFNFLPEVYEDDFQIGNLTLTYDFDAFELLSSTSYTTRDMQVLTDITTTSNLGVGLLNAFTGSPQPVYLDNLYDIEAISQEIRLTSTWDNDFQWILGGFFSDRTIEFMQPLFSPDPASHTAAIPGGPAAGTSIFAPFGAEPGLLLNTDAILENRQFSAYGEAMYDLTDRLSGTVGLRYFNVDQDFDSTQIGFLAGTGDGMPVGEPRSVKEDGINPKFLVSYDLSDDILLSAQASKGFRFGGPQSFVPIGPDPACTPDLTALGLTPSDIPDGFDSESLWNYEIGMKSTLGGRVQLNASIYRIDYTDLQVTTRLAGCGFSFTTNAGEARSQGAEFELKGQVSDGLEAFLGGSYTDAELRSDLPSNEAVEGDRLLYVPRLKLNGGVNYETSVSDALNGFFQAFVQYTGAQETLQSNRPRAATVDSFLDAYVTANVRIGVFNDNWELAFYVNNVTDKYAATYLESLNPAGPGGADYQATIRPRTIGINTKIRF